MLRTCKPGKGDRLPEPLDRATSRMITRPDCTTGRRRRSFMSPTMTMRSAGWSRRFQRVLTGRTPAIFIVEDDAQDGPDHVDAHRSPAFVISAYNRPGALDPRISQHGQPDPHAGVVPRDRADEFSRCQRDADRYFTNTPDLGPYQAAAADGRARQSLSARETDAAMAVLHAA